MADFRLGRLKFKWKGNWTASTAYVIDDIVKYGGNSYVCTANHTSTSAETTFYSSDNAKWSVHTEGIVNKGNWAATTWYKINDVVKYGNTQYRVTAGFTSGATFSDSNTVVYLEGLKYEDTWAASTTYQVGDIVTYGGYSYSAKTNHSSAVVPNSDATNWAVLTVGFEAKGEYASGVTYKLGDVVRYGGNSYVNILVATAGTDPTNNSNWRLLAEGFNWTGNWAAGTAYKLNDVVNRTSNSYVCIQAHTGQQPETDTGGVYWNYIAQGGSAAQVLTTTGDLLFQSAGTIARLGLPPTGTAEQQKVASGQVLTVGGSPLLPQWESNNTSAPVYYVTKEGSNSNSGKQISRGFATLRYACDQVSALTGAAKPTATNPITIYVKSGIYEEQLPIHVPEFTSVIGDNIRSTSFTPASGDSDELDLVFQTAATHVKLGDVVSNSAKTKTAKVMKHSTGTTLTLLPVTGGVWTTSDKYVDIINNKYADGRDVLNNNRVFLAHEAYHRHVANVGAVTGAAGGVKDQLTAFVDALAFNLKHGSNNEVWDFTNSVLSGTDITGDVTQDNQLIEYVRDAANTILAGGTATVSAGNSETQTAYSGTADTNNPKCPNVTSAVTTLAAIFTSCRTANNMGGTSKSEPFIDITTVSTVSNIHSTFIYLADHTIVKDCVFNGLAGFAANGADDKNIEAAVIKGVYFELDPASAVTKSPYIQNCSALGGAALGVLCDGDSHVHFDNSPTPSFKSMCFDAFTQVLEGGAGFWCKGTAAMEIVSSFTYYHHMSYCSTGGGKIRAVSGNSSYGKYGCISRGFDPNEVTTDGTIAGLRLNINASGSSAGTFTDFERIQGNTSGAVGQLRSNQILEANYLNYIPIKGTFQDGEVIQGIGSTVPNITASGATVTLKASNAVTGQYGYQLIAEGLALAPDQGGSVEYVDNGSTNDSSSYVISSASYGAPDGRGSLTVTRGSLGSSAAVHSGTDTVALFPVTAATGTTLTAGIDASVTSIDLSVLTGVAQNGFVVVDNELMIITGVTDADTITVTRAQEGTSAATHANGAAVTVLGAKVASQDTLLKDTTDVTTDIRVTQGGIIFKAGDYAKINNEFMLLSAAAADTTGITIINFADEKASSAAAGADQLFKIRFRYSQVRLTAHDFLDVGTGDRSTTNWPGLPSQANVPANEINEVRPGRVYYVSTDQDGNFAVGEYFKVEQATGKATLNANAFNLSGLDQLQLGAIGATLGAMIDEFSIDGTLAQNSDAKVPTQKAVKTYVDAQIGGGGASTTINTAGDTGTGSVATGTQTLSIVGTTNEIETQAASQTIYVKLPDDVTVGNNLTVTNDLAISGNTVLTGNLTVNGTTSTVSTANTTVSDKLLELGTGTTGSPTGDIGIILERGDSNNAFIGWDESADKFTLATTTATGSSAGDLTLTTGTLVANIEGNLTGNITGNVTGNLTGNVTGNATGLSSTPNISVGTIACGNITGTGTVSDSMGDVRKLLVRSVSSAYTLVIGDSGRFVDTTGAATVTVPNGVFSAGQMVTILNNSGSDMTLAQGGGFSLYNGADGSTGNKIMGARSTATILFQGSANGYLSGSKIS